MKKKLSEWMNKARTLEAAIGARVEGAAQTASARQPLEIVHAIVDAIGRELQPSGRGQQAFPYTLVRVLLRAGTSKEKAKLEVACEGPPNLEIRIHERLTTARCTSPLPVVKIVFAASAKPDWTDKDFHLDLSRSAVLAPPSPPSPPEVPRPSSALELTVQHGTAEQESYVFSGGVTAIGRGSEVRDRDGRLLRTNHVVFVEGAGDVNGSVSRRHARIEYERSDDGYRLFDDTGSERTSVVRDGKGLRVPHGRGLRLRAGDVIAVGDARIGVKLLAP